MAVPKPLTLAGRALSNGLYRVFGGRVMGKARGLPVLLITIPGRKTGDPHTTPVSYFEDDGQFIVTGSGSGSAREPQWFKNLRQTDEADIEVGRRKLAVSVAVIEGCAARDPLATIARTRTLLRRLPKEGRARDTNGDLDSKALITR